MYNLSASVLAGKHNHYMTQGLWVIVGLLAFLLLEKMFPDQDGHEDPTSDSDLNSNSAVSVAAERSLTAHRTVNTNLHLFFCLVC